MIYWGLLLYIGGTTFMWFLMWATRNNKTYDEVGFSVENRAWIIFIWPIAPIVLVLSWFGKFVVWTIKK